MDTQTQIDRLIELAIVQRADLKALVDQLPQLRDHLNAEVERTFEQAEPQIRIELEEFVAKQTEDKTSKLGSVLEAKVSELAKTLQESAQAKFSALMAERDRNAELLAQAEGKIAAAAAALGSNVKEIVLAELDRFPRAGEIDRLRKEFAEPRGLNPRGKWSSSEVYQKLDLVSYNGDSFVSSINDNRERPSRNSESWTLSAARGLGGSGGGVSLKDQYGGGDYGQLLIGNGGDWSSNTLTAGTGVTIENGAGTITISAASGGGQTLSATVTNAESFAITRGQVVYISGASGNRASVKLASNSSETTSSKTFGVVSDASIAAGQAGTVVCQGEVSNLNLGTYTDGQTVYLGASAGSFTSTKPSAPNHLVYVGTITRANAGSGILYVKIQNGYELDEIHDVAISSPTTGQTIVYNSSTSLWNNSNALTLSGGSVDNSPIGAGTPSTGAFTTLSASGLANFTNTTKAASFYISSVGGAVNFTTGTQDVMNIHALSSYANFQTGAATTNGFSFSTNTRTNAFQISDAGGLISNLTGLTTSVPALSATQTWSAVGTTFTGLKLNVTDTASAAGSLLLDLQVNSSSKFKVDKTGSVTLATALPISSGGTGGATASDARTNLGLGTIATQAASSVSLTGGSAANLKVLELIEDGTVSATAATGSLNYDVKTQTVLYYTTNASGNWTLNIRGDGSTTLDSLLAVGDSITLAFLVTQGSTAYYCTAITVDGASNTPKWQGGTAPTAGNASGIDSYTYTVIKTASATFTVLAAQTQFK